MLLIKQMNDICDMIYNIIDIFFLMNKKIKLLNKLMIKYLD